MDARRADRAYAALVALTALAIVLVYTVGEARYEFAQLLGLAVLAVALVKLARGSFAAWSVLFVINVLPAALAVMVSLAPGSSIGSPLAVAIAASVPLLALLLSPAIRHRVRYVPPQPHTPGRPSA